jgi:hypothetical protein
MRNMTFTNEQQKLLLGALIAVIVAVNGYRLLTAEGPGTAPLMYDRGVIAHTPLRPSTQVRGGATDPLSVILERSAEPYPGVVRNIFRMENPGTRPKPKPAAPVVVTAPSPSAPERSPEEIAADLARADLAKFRYLGYLTEKDNSLFLSKDGELFIVKIGDTIGTTYKIKEANKDFIVILDTATRVEGRVSLSGEGTQPLQPQRPLYAPQPFPPRVSQP